jgi:endoglucanase
LSGAEYNNSNPKARLGWDYMYPSTTEIDYYAAKGFTTIRLPFAGSRVQPQNDAPLNVTELGYIQTIVTYCASKHITVILDPHDYGLKYDSVSGKMLPLGMPAGLPASSYADFWSRLAQAFKEQSNVIFGLMNEPNQQSPAQWASVANAAIAAIRSAGATQLILIPGTDYTGAYDWVSSGNAATWAHVSDPAKNFAFEVHQYLDSDNSGTHASCVAGNGSTALIAATTWARSNGYHLFLGEVGWSQDPSCTNEGPALMHYTTANPDVWIGWTYWAGGPWIPQSYIFMLDPANLANPVDKPQMQVLVDNL